LRYGRDSSMQVALERVSSGTCAAAVSGGSTGALMVLSRHVLGMLPGIERPALMAALPARNALVWVLDLKTNISVDARRLYEFACMGGAAAGVINGRQPAVGLLNIGREASKGPDVVREAARLIKRTAIWIIRALSRPTRFSMAGLMLWSATVLPETCCSSAPKAWRDSCWSSSVKKLQAGMQA